MVKSILIDQMSPEEWFRECPQTTPTLMRGYGDEIENEIIELKYHISKLEQWLDQVANLQANECTKNEK